MLGGLYIEELGVVFLAVDDWFTHVGFCVGHEDSVRLKIVKVRQREKKRKMGEGENDKLGIEKLGLSHVIALSLCNGFYRNRICALRVLGWGFRSLLA